MRFCPNPVDQRLMVPSRARRGSTALVPRGVRSMALESESVKRGNDAPGGEASTPVAEYTVKCDTCNCQRSHTTQQFANAERHSVANPSHSVAVPQ